MSNKEFFLIKKSNDYYLYDESKSWAIGSSNDRQRTPNGHKLSIENCNEIFGDFSIEEIALSKASYFGGTYRNPEGFSDEQIGYLHGFIEGAELNKDKLFTVEDMDEAIRKAKSYDEIPNHEGIVVSFNYSKDEIIESLQHKIIEVEILYDKDCYSSAGRCDKSTMAQCIICTPVYPLKDDNGCVTLIKKK
jgi:hypothetical protein